LIAIELTTNESTGGRAYPLCRRTPLLKVQRSQFPIWVRLRSSAFMNGGNSLEADYWPGRPVRST
jgi:hypothetical protein